MSLRRLVQALTVACALVVGAAPAALAQEVCYPPPCAPGISDSTVGAGQPVSVTSGTASYQPGEPVEYGVASTYQRLGQTTADASGAAIATFQMPDLEPGRHNVVFTSLVDGKQVRVPFTLTAAAPPGTDAGTGTSPGTGTGVSPGTGTTATPAGGTAVSRKGGRLARTGSADLVLLAVAGTVMIGAGAGALAVSRRRRESVAVRAA